MKLQPSLKTILLSSALVTASVAANAETTNYEMTGQEKIDYLISSIDAINARLQDGSVRSVGAVGYAAIGGVIEDGSLDSSMITAAELNSYLEAKELVLNHDYAIAQTAEQMFMQEHAAAMNSLSLAVDDLTAATSIIMTAVSVAAVAAEADTKPEQVALQGMIATDEYSIDAAEVNDYNEAATAVENFAQQAGAFMAAANNDELTASIDSYASQGNFLVGSYTAITYTQNVDEFVITWADSGFGSGWQGYLSNDMKSADDVYAAGEYIEQYGGYPTQ